MTESTTASAPEPDEPATASALTSEAIEELAADDEPVTDMRAVRRLRTENQRLRHQLREAEANRASMEEAHIGDLARLSNLERRAVESTVADVLADPADLWLHTTEAQQREWIDQQFGEVIPDAARDAARALIESRPHLARRAMAPPSNQPIEGLRPGASPQESKPVASWHTAIRGS